jgi:hypothetical protein
MNDDDDAMEFEGSKVSRRQEVHTGSNFASDVGMSCTGSLALWSRACSVLSCLVLVLEG